MKVTLLNHTPEPEKMVAMAARICYDKDGDIDKLKETMTSEKIDKFLKKMMELKNHGTPFEHPSFTFGIEGVSRALTHQLVRHRIASFDQRSQRYCKEDQFEYIVPPSIKNNSMALEYFHDTMVYLQGAYTLLEALGVPKEDARMVLPNACCSSLIMTMNLRSLYHFFSLRCCNRAQWEIRTMANEMLRLCKDMFPILFKNAGASCNQLGYCPEGHMSCGAYPTLEKLIDSYKENSEKENKT